MQKNIMRYQIPRQEANYPVYSVSDDICKFDAKKHKDIPIGDTMSNPITIYR